MQKDDVSTEEPINIAGTFYVLLSRERLGFLQFSEDSIKEAACGQRKVLVRVVADVENGEPCLKIFKSKSRMSP